MNSIERFNDILDHKKPDRMPFYIPTVACSVASRILGHEAHTGGDSLHFKEEFSWTQGVNAHDEFVHKYREDIMEVAKKLQVDVVRETWRCSRKPSRKIDEHTLLFGDENGRYIVKRFFPEYQSYGTVMSTEERKDVDELKSDLLERMKRNKPVTDDMLSNDYKDHLAIKEMAGSDYATIIGALALGFPMFSTIWLEASALESEFLRDYYLYEAEKMTGRIRWFKEQGFRYFNAGSDIASQDGPVVSPVAFETMLGPALSLLASECKKQDMVYSYGSDGNMWKLCDAIFKRAGVQAYGEADRSATMTVGALRERYPGVIVLGNVSSVTLCTGSVEQVREETRETLMESGGYDYIAGPSNAIVHGTPVANVYAMVEEIKSFRP